MVRMLNVNKKQLRENVIITLLETLEDLGNKEREQFYNIGCSYCDAQISFFNKINSVIHR